MVQQLYAEKLYGSSKAFYAHTYMGHFRLCLKAIYNFEGN